MRKNQRVFVMASDRTNLKNGYKANKRNMRENQRVLETASVGINVKNCYKADECTHTFES